MKLLPPPQKNRSEFPFAATADFAGIHIGIENKKGSFRSGKDKSGKQWRVKMNAHYGEVLGSLGVDGDPVDVYVLDNPRSSTVFCVDQLCPDTGAFDEQKFILGANSKADAIALYRSQYDKPGFMGRVRVLSLARFKEWLAARANRGKRFVKSLEGVTDMRVSVPVSGYSVVVMLSKDAAGIRKSLSFNWEKKRKARDAAKPDSGATITPASPRHGSAESLHHFFHALHGARPDADTTKGFYAARAWDLTHRAYLNPESAKQSQDEADTATKNGAAWERGTTQSGGKFGISPQQHSDMTKVAGQVGTKLRAQHDAAAQGGALPSAFPQEAETYRGRHGAKFTASLPVKAARDAAIHKAIEAAFRGAWLGKAADAGMMPPAMPPAMPHGVPAAAPSAYHATSPIFHADDSAVDTKTQHTDQAGNYSPQRAALHRQIIGNALGGAEHGRDADLHRLYHDYRDKSVKPQAVFTMGGAGSGKSYYAKKKFLKHPRFVSIDPDAVKEHLANAEGRPGEHNTNPERYHEESSDIAKKMQEEAHKQGKSYVLDGTGANLGSFTKKIQSAKDAGYHTSVHMAHVHVDTALARNAARPRHVPEHIVRDQHANVRGNFEKVRGMVDNARVVDTSNPTANPYAEKRSALMGAKISKAASHDGGLKRIVVRPGHAIIGRIIGGHIHVEDILSGGTSERAITGQKPGLRPIPLSKFPGAKVENYDGHLSKAPDALLSALPAAPPAFHAPAAAVHTNPAVAQHLSSGPKATANFTHGEMALPNPKTLVQHTKELPKLLEHAGEHKEWQDHIIDRDKGVGPQNGMHHVDIDLTPNGAGKPSRLLTHDDFHKAHQQGGMVVTAPKKGGARLADKVNNKFGGDASKLMDLSRATVAVLHVDDIPHVTKALRDNGMKYGAAPRDRFNADNAAGYRDMQLTPTSPNGHHGELQVHQLDMLRAKELGLPEHGFHKSGHESYEFQRDHEEGKHEHTAENVKRYHDELEYSNRLYNKAAEIANTRRPAFGKHAMEKAMTRPQRTRLKVKTAAEIKDHVARHLAPGYYDWDGQPAVRIGHAATPKVWNAGKKSWTPVHDLKAFDHEAERVAKPAFDAIVARHGAHTKYHL